MKKLKYIFVLLFLAGTLTSCYTHTHLVGSGAKGSTSQSKGQWYILFGIVPLNSVDSKGLAGGATDYTIKTQQTFLDGVVSIFTGLVTISKQTVNVTK